MKKCLKALVSSIKVAFYGLQKLGLSQDSLTSVSTNNILIDDDRC